MARTHAGMIGLVVCAGLARAQPTPPPITSVAWFTWYQSLLATRLAACPLARGTTYYFSQAGDDLAGDGSIANPWKSLARAQTVLDNTPGGDVALLFRRGDVWHETTGLRAVAPNITIADFGSGDKPLFTAFESVTDTAGWAPAAGKINTYQRTETATVTWAKEDDNLDMPYARRASAAAVEATEGSWWWDSAAKLLYVHPRHSGGAATDPRTDGKPYELVRPRSNGIQVYGNGTRLQNIRTAGWGMTTGAITQEHGIDCRSEGTDQIVVVGCESHYGMTHAMTKAGHSGGITTFVDCSAGLTTFVDNGGTEFNTYSDLGGYQTIWDHCTATHGALPSENHSGRQGWGFYGHTDAQSGHTAALAIANACTVRDTTYGCTAGANFADVPVVATLADVRCFIVGEVVEGGAGTGDGLQLCLANAARVNGRYLNLSPPSLPAGALASWPAGGWVINCTVQLNLSAQTIDCALYNAPPFGPSQPHIWSSDIRVVTAPGLQFRIDFDIPNQSPSGNVYNTIISNAGPGTCAPNVGSGSSALVSNAYYGVVASAFASDPSPRVLNQLPVMDAEPACISALSCASVPPPGGPALEFDQRGQVRERNTIGPIQSPPCANCDGSTTPPVININDFVCFLGKFAFSDPSANCDGSTTDPVLNINDFSCFLNMYARGCH